MSFPKRSRRPYLLLEVLLSFSLVLLCFLPLLYPTVKIVAIEKKETHKLKEKEETDFAFYSLVKDLYEGRETLSSLVQRKDIAILEKKEGDPLSFYILEMKGEEGSFSYPFFLRARTVPKNL